ncbi:MAG TPA: Gfo/Idh/MocA family oxidoreductase [Chitinophagaceae bacterium]
MVNVALIGAGKMGLSHLSILGAHPDVRVTGVTDTSKMILDVLKKFSGYSCYQNYEQMLSEIEADAVVVAVPTKFHSPMVKTILQQGKHVFAEKPLCLTAEEAAELVTLAEQTNAVNQVGYHNKFVGTFQELKKIVDGGYLGNLFNFVGETAGPVVVRTKQENWRGDPEEGGGCLMDYASHVIDLINYIIAPVETVKAAVLKPMYSKRVEDSVYALLEVGTGLSGVLMANWSDITYRKMTTSITVQGSKGKVICDANELKAYFNTSEAPQGYTRGWNVKYVTDLTPSVDFYLRGEEYSAQIDYFIRAVQKQVPNTINTFKTAWQTDKAISLIKRSSS